MRKTGLAALALLPLVGGARTPKDVVDSVGRSIGAADLKSIQYSGAGYVFYLGQSFQPGDPWPEYNIKSYTDLVDYEKGASREEQVWTQYEKPQHGGVVPFVGERRQVAFLSGDFAWNAGAGGATTPAPEAVEERQVQMAITPHGWVKAAMAANPTMKLRTVNGKEMSVVSFTIKGKYKVNGYVNNQDLLEKVETWIPNPVLGDMLVETSYSDYRDFSGVKFPGRIVQKQGGFPVLDLTIRDVQPNARANIEAPDAVRRAPRLPVRVESQKLSDGVWFIGGGTHNSVAVEFKDYVAVIEAPLNEERSLAVIAEVKRLVSGKPIRYLINTHHHFDHLGGIRTYVAEGATIITHKVNKAFYEQTFRMPHTLSPDKLSQNPRATRIEAVTDKYLLTDGARLVEVHLVRGNPHNAGMLMAYLPNEKLLVEADVFILPPPKGPIASARSWTVNLQENLERLKLDVRLIAPIHGPVVPVEELRNALAKSE